MPEHGRWRARLAEDGDDLRAAQALRHAAFIEGGGAARRPGGLDADAFDARCDHLLVEDGRTLAATFRMLPMPDGRAIGASYSAQFYDLSALAAFEGRVVEMGRFCIRPDLAGGAAAAQVLRVAWSAMTRYVDERGIGLLIGCSSFPGTDAAAHEEAFALLRERHLAPSRWGPAPKAPRIFRFARALAQRRADAAAAMRRMPPLLRGYLGLGGWVSDHAVIDAEMNTLHVFTGVEVARVPARMARRLRAT